MAAATDPGAARKPTLDAIYLLGVHPLFGAGDPGGAKFNLKEDAPTCDVVMKGGVTSGVVYPYAILRLAQDFRLAGIGGTSAGAMAACLTAAAEFARQSSGDHLAFSRFEGRCMKLPALLPRLFQPFDEHRAVFSLAMTLLEATDASTRLGERLKLLARLFRGPASLFTYILLLSGLIGGLAPAARYVWFYGFRVGRLPHTGPLNPGVAAGLLAAGAGLASGLVLLGLIYLAVRTTRRWPVLVYFLLVGGAVALSILSPLGGLDAVLAPAWLGGAFATVAAVLILANHVFSKLRTTSFGMCSGLRRPDAKDPAVTDWLHEAIQDVAGRPSGAPLTFGDIEAAAPKGSPPLALRMITTNMTLRRPYALPDLGGARGGLAWRPSEWRELFPDTVVEHMKAGDPEDLPDDVVRPLPDGSRWPIVVGARMSLSFPILFSAVPIYEWSSRTTLASSQARGVAEWDRRKMLLIDGGLSSNMPLHFFDSLGPPAYPTFAFSLDEDKKAAAPAAVRLRRVVAGLTGPLSVAEGATAPSGLAALRQRLEAATAAAPRSRVDSEKARISLLKPRQRPPTLKVQPVRLMSEYLGGLLGAAKDWQDNLLSIMPGQFDRIVHIRLAPSEGGLNLVMPPFRSRLLMRLGYYAGAELAETFDLGAHRVRRALASYQEIERVAETFARVWTTANLQTELATAQAPFGSRTAWRGAQGDIILRFGQLAQWAQGLGQPIRNKHFPRPRGALRITPNLSGDV